MNADQKKTDKKEPTASWLHAFDLFFFLCPSNPARPPLSSVDCTVRASKITARPRREIVGQEPPSAAGLDHVPHGVEQFAERVLFLAASSRISVRYGTTNDHSSSDTSEG